KKESKKQKTVKKLTKKKKAGKKAKKQKKTTKKKKKTAKNKSTKKKKSSKRKTKKKVTKKKATNKTKKKKQKKTSTTAKKKTRKKTKKKAKKKATKSFSHIDQGLLDKIKDIFLNSSTVSKDLNALFDASNLATLFPAFETLKSKDKMKGLTVYDHTLFMIELIEYIERHDTQGFNKDKANWDMTDEYMTKYQAMFTELTNNGQDRQMRALIYFIVLFHDIGEAVDKMTHHAKSAALVPAWFKAAGFTPERRRQATKTIAAHVNLGCVFIPSRTPGYLQSAHSLDVANLGEAEKVIYFRLLSLLTTVDVRSLVKGRFFEAGAFEVSDELTIHGNAEFYLRAAEEGFLEEFATQFFTFRMKMYCSTPAHVFLPAKYAQAEEALTEAERILGDECPEFVEAVRAGMQVLNYYDYFLWGLDDGASVVKILALTYILTKGRDIIWVDNNVGSSGEAGMIASFIEEDFLENLSLEDILESTPKALQQTLSEKGIATGYKKRGALGDVLIIESKKLYTTVDLEALLNAMLQEALPDKQAPPEAPAKTPLITAERDGTTLKVTFSGKLPEAVRAHPRTAAKILRQWINVKRFELTLLGPKGRKLPILPKRITEITFDTISLTVDLNRIKAKNYTQLKVAFSVPQEDKEAPAKIYEGIVNITDFSKKTRKRKEIKKKAKKKKTRKITSKKRAPRAANPKATTHRKYSIKKLVNGPKTQKPKVRRKYSIKKLAGQDKSVNHQTNRKNSIKKKAGRDKADDSRKAKKKARKMVKKARKGFTLIE
ncbi:hypothetical protein ACFL2W_01175, partial [Candidatus Omnitrophota bacterium]